MTEILVELGERHYRSYGVTSEMYPVMGTAVLDTLKDLLGDAFDRDTHYAWRELWHEFSRDMTKGETDFLKRELRRLSTGSSRGSLRV